MAEMYEIQVSGTEKDDVCEGIISIKYSGLSFERKKQLDGRAHGAVNTMKATEGKKPEVADASLKNLKNQKKTEETKDTEPDPSHSPRIAEEPPKNIIRGQLTVFLRNLALPRDEVVAHFRGHFPKRTDTTEDILRAWDREHPKIEIEAKPVPGDKVKYNKSSLAPIGTVEKIDKNGLKMDVRYGINDVKSVFCADYHVVERKGGQPA